MNIRYIQKVNHVFKFDMHVSAITNCHFIKLLIFLEVVSELVLYVHVTDEKLNSDTKRLVYFMSVILALLGSCFPIGRLQFNSTIH